MSTKPIAPMRYNLGQRIWYARHVNPSLKWFVQMIYTMANTDLNSLRWSFEK